jgi:type IV secretory pathway VirJ component
MRNRAVKIGIGILAVLLLVAAMIVRSPTPTSVALGRFGEARLFAAKGIPRAVVVLFAGKESWSDADSAAAVRLAENGATVVGVDLARYRNVAGTSDTCLYLVGDIERATLKIERHHRFAHYLAPILAGVGKAGALAQAMLAQAPAGAIAGIVAVDPAAAIDMGRPICTSPPREAGVAGTPGFLLASFSDQASDVGKAALARAAAPGTPVEITPFPPASSQAESLAQLILGRLATVARSSGSVVGDLPLVAQPPPAPGAPLVVIMSGDGGWRDIDKVIADDLGKRGLAVLGWDSLSYFWTAKTPEQLGRDLAVALSYYGDKWHTGPIALVGYSFGADVLPFAVDRLPAELRARIVQLSLLGYGGKADFKIHIAGWLGESTSAAALPAAPEMARIDSRRVQCFYGADESDSACPGLAASGAELVMLSGGHHFGGDYGAIAARIADGLTRGSAGLQ